MPMRHARVPVRFGLFGMFAAQHDGLKLSPGHFRVDWEEVAAAITPRTRMIIVNTLHNPTATVFSEDDFAQLTRETGIVILSARSANMSCSTARGTRAWRGTASWPSAA